MNTVVQTKSKLPMIITLVLVIVLGIMAARLMWLIVAPKQVAASHVKTAIDSTIVAKEKINYGKIIASHNLFGAVTKSVKTPVSPAAPQKKAATKLNLKLHGIVAYKSSKKGFALISKGSGVQKVYGEGDELQDGVTVSEVFSDKVVLDNQGKIEELLLPIKVDKSNSQKVTTIPENLPRGNVPSVKPGDINLAAIRQEALSSPQKLLDVASPSPAIINGKFIGFRVRPGRKRKLFRQLGFRPNDIIIEVNGIILDDSSKGAMVLGELSQASELSVTVKRGSQEILINHSF